MRSLWPVVGLVVLLLTACQAPAADVATTAPVETGDATDLLPYRDATLSIEERVADLLSRMTLAEKIGQMTLVEQGSIDADGVRDRFVGAVLSGGGGSPRTNTPEAWLEMVNTFQDGALATRLGIPILYGVDAVHGHNNVKGATIFPHNIGLGAANNPELMTEIGRITAREVAATGITWNYAPAVSVPQDIRWGRTYEGYSENTDIVTDLSSAFLRGLQGDALNVPDTILATPKHYVGDGGTVWGTSTTNDYEIDQGVTMVSEEELRAVHLPPYVAAIDNGAQSIMVSYSSWQETKMHAQSHLLNDVLKQELGFGGFLVSDWEAIDQIDPGDFYESVVTAINAGIDMNMVPYNYTRFIDTLTEAVENGDVSQTRIDEAVRRILTVKFELGLFEQPLGDGALLSEVGSAAHREVARQAVRESLVLLQNENATLPLDKATPVLFVAGEAADDIGIQSGGWTIEWQGKTGNITPGTTILDGIEAAVSAETAIQYNRFGNYDRIVDDNGDPVLADVGIVVVGERPYAEGVGDSNDLTLSDTEYDLIQRVRDRSEALLVILVSGRPLIVTEELALTDAFVAAWLPGTEGQGVADVLFGDFPFTGQLPYTWPRDMSQLPAAGIDDPLFPLGYGLTTSTP